MCGESDGGGASLSMAVAAVVARCLPQWPERQRSTGMVPTHHPYARFVMRRYAVVTPSVTKIYTNISIYSFLGVGVNS